MWKRIGIITGVVLVAGALTVQQASLRRLERDLAALQDNAGSTPAAARNPSVPFTAPPGETVVQRVPMDPAVHDRLSALEESVVDLARTSNYLMERGTVPLVESKIAEMVARMNDLAVSDAERLRTLRLLRRNNSLDDSSVSQAFNWLNTSTNANLREDILEQLEGLTNAIARVPLLQLAGSDTDAEVREQAVDNLGRFVGDPQVETTLWTLLKNDPDPEVREEAINALRSAPMTEARVALMRQHIMDTTVNLDERLGALRALRGADPAISDLVVSFAQQAHASQDPGERATLFAAFDGFTDPALKAPLVYGLQDPNPLIRERAADALSGYRNDEAVREWLQYVAQHDADPRVRREALQALGSSRR